MKFADAVGGIDTCEKAKVLWRKSNENISPDKSVPILIRKIQALTDNAKWLADLPQNKVMETSGFIPNIRLVKLGEISFCLLKSRKQNYWRIIEQRFILPFG